MKETPLKTGLTTPEVQDRKTRGLINKTNLKVDKTIPQIIAKNTFTYFNLIFLVLAILVASVGSIRNLTFVPVIILNTLIGIIQEIRTKKVLDKMNLLNAPKTTVLRDGKQQRIPSDDLVKDDIVIFTAGDQIPADAKILEGEVAVNESLLTGETDEIRKSATPENLPEKAKKDATKLLSGSFIVSGECTAILEKVGRDSYISKLALKAKAMKQGETSEMIRSINTIVKIAGIIIIPIGIGLFLQNFFVNHLGTTDSVTHMVAAVIGMIPEGLYLLTTIALAVGTIRLAKNQVLLHDMRSIESLARVDTLCVDKTGTITSPEMHVKSIIPLEDSAPIKLYTYVQFSTDKNDTAKAIKNHFKNQKLETAQNFKLKKFHPFSSTTKFGALETGNETYFLGAPEFVLDKNNIKQLKSQIAAHTKKGDRVLVFAVQNSSYDPENPAKNQTSRTPLALVVLGNPLRKNAEKIFAYFKAQAVDIKVISGDNPETVSEVARQAGIDHYDKFLDATTLKTDAEIAHAVKNYAVFGRVTPVQKQKFVLALKQQGRTVAMTGDGVNDILALKNADCSIAMASGSEATAAAAEVVLLDSDFAHMPEVVGEGRRIVNNIQRSATLFLVKNTFSLLMALASLLLLLTYPLEPSQITLVSMFTIGFPGFLLAFEPNNNRIKGHFLRTALLRALPAGITNAIIIASMTTISSLFGLDKNLTATIAVLLLALTGFMVLIRISRPFTRYRAIVLTLAVAGFALFFLFLSEIFGVTTPTFETLLLILPFALAAVLIYHLLAHLFDKLLARPAKFLKL